MNCPICGNEIPEKSSFCPKCGAKLKEQSEIKTEGLAKQKEKKKLPLKAIGPIIACIFVCIMIIVAVANKRVKINLNDYITVVFDGYDTKGKATYEFDYARLEEDYGDKLKYTSKAKDMFDENELYELAGEALDTPIYLFEEGISCSLDNDRSLSNGDIVTLKWDIDKDVFEQIFKVRLLYDDIAYTAEGLAEAEVFDPFSGIEVVFDGISPNGNAIINKSNNSEPYSHLQYSIDKSTSLSNGDEVTVTVKNSGSLDIDDYCIENFGMIPSETEKKYTVEGLAKYVTSFDEIPEEIVESMKKETEDGLSAKAASQWNKYVTLEKMDYIGNYFLTSKNASSSNNINLIVMVYKITADIDISNKDYKSKVNYYYSSRFKDLIILPDGTCSVDLSKMSTPSSSFVFTTTVPTWLGYTSFSFKGYEDVQSMFSNEVTANVDKYNYENNVSEDLTVENTTETDSDKNNSARDGYIEYADEVTGIHFYLPDDLEVVAKNPIYNSDTAGHAYYISGEGMNDEFLFQTDKLSDQTYDNSDGPEDELYGEVAHEDGYHYSINFVNPDTQYDFKLSDSAVKFIKNNRDDILENAWVEK